MRKIIVFNHITADGYFASADGQLDWVVSDDEVFKTAAKSNDEVDTMLFGRRTYEMFESFWPKQVKDAKGAQDPHEPGHRSDAIQDQAVWINNTAKVVFSKSRKDVTWNNSRLVREIAPDAIQKMKDGPGKNMIIFGSGMLVTQLTEHRLIDEYQFLVHPVILGSGKMMIAGLSNRLKLNRLEQLPFKSGVTLERYARA